MAEMKFEDALKKLEEIVERLEAGDLALEDALAKYEEGIKLSKLCAKKLDAAKRRVEILLKADDGSVELAPFDENTVDEPARPAETRKKKESAR